MAVMAVKGLIKLQKQFFSKVIYKLMSWFIKKFWGSSQGCELEALRNGHKACRFAMHYYIRKVLFVHKVENLLRSYVQTNICEVFTNLSQDSRKFFCKVPYMLQ